MSPLNRTKELMKFFVGEVIGRRITPADFRSRHMSEGKILLKDYRFDDICGALMSLKSREYTHFGYDKDELPTRLDSMRVLLYWGEPPLIERWLTPPERPPVYSCDFDVWVRRWGKRALEREDWDGIYVRQDPRKVRGWLVPIIGKDRFEESLKRWQIRQPTSPQKEPSLNTSPTTPPSLTNY